MHVDSLQTKTELYMDSIDQERAAGILQKRTKPRRICRDSSSDAGGLAVDQGWTTDVLSIDGDRTVGTLTDQNRTVAGLLIDQDRSIGRLSIEQDRTETDLLRDSDRTERGLVMGQARTAVNSVHQNSAAAGLSLHQDRAVGRPSLDQERTAVECLETRIDLQVHSSRLGQSCRWTYYTTEQNRRLIPYTVTQNYRWALREQDRAEG